MPENFVLKADNQSKPTVILLGVFHMANPGLDAVNLEFDDVLAPKRQEEIRECVDLLKRSCPTKVAVEKALEKADELNEEYRRYRAGELELGRNEIHQLGFRIAAELNHDKIYAVDWWKVEGFFKYTEDQFEQWVKENQPEMFDLMEHEIQKLASEVRGIDVQTRSIREMLGSNLEDGKRIHQLYFQTARIGKGNEHLGIDNVMWWYRRNMTIYANVTRLVNSPEDRILVMFGNGHSYLLNQFFQESGLFNVELADTYLHR
ncbi:MAG: hypothetical protein K6T83_08125 [Alicyclobacillus sp.]|nr:hypothetical protein [Alicyclobacillus sp.]